MKKVGKNAKSKLVIVTRPEEGIILTRQDQERYQYIAISQNQVRQVIDSLADVILAYQQRIEAVTDAMRAMIAAQERVAKQMQDMFKSIEHFRKVSALIQIPKIENLVPNLTNLLDIISTRNPLEEPVRIFIQPDEPFEKPKALTAPHKKYNLPLTSVQIIADGFTIEGQYIKGMTRKSQAGRLFELFIRSDLKGKVSDQLLDEILGTEYSDFDYHARSYMIRDLKDALAGNKIKIDIKRYRGIKQYVYKGLTKLLRKPRKAKKHATTN